MKRLVGERSVLPSLFPDKVVTEETDTVSTEGRLFPEEEALVRRAVRKRRAEFVTGRLCARKALAKLGIADFPILMTKDRAPVWPSDIVGSISHAEGYCGAAVARRESVLSVGLDIEHVGRLARESWKHVCTGQELSWIESLGWEEQHLSLAIAFSAKECVYKCLYQLERRWLDFHDLAISILQDVGEFEAELLKAAGRRYGQRSRFTGKYAVQNGLVFTGLALERAGDYTGRRPTGDPGKHSEGLMRLSESS